MLWKHCPQCGGALQEKSEKLLVCGSCDFHWYQNPLPTNAVIIANAAGEIMLAKRNAEPKTGCYDLPGGFVDPGESLEDSARREILEELQVELRDVRFFRSYPGRYLYKGVNYYTMVCVLTGSIGEQEPKVASDIGGIEFFAPDKLPFDKIAFPALEQGLRDYVQEREK